MAVRSTHLRRLPVHRRVTIAVASILTASSHYAAMPTKSLPPATEVEPAWRLFKLNWVVLASMGAALAIGVGLSNFSIEPTGLLVSLGFVAMYAGFAHANARSPGR